MARFQKIIDISRLSDAAMQQLQPGQWVYTDVNTPLSRGKFWGIKKSGTVVVAWQGNAINRSSWTEYQRSLRNYALSTAK